MSIKKRPGQENYKSRRNYLLDESKPKLAPWREKIYEIIFEADTWPGLIFDLLLLLAILGSVIVACLETVESIRIEHGDTLIHVEWIFTILFTVEYMLRIICVRRPLRYMTSFFGIVDMLACLPGLGMMITGSRSSFSVLRLFRLLRVFRLLQLGWFMQESDELGRAIWQARAKIVVFLTVVFICVTVAGALMYELEHKNREQFSSIPDSIYWATVTMTTVGYGDIVPRSPTGKFLSAMLIVIGYSLIIVPSGFVSAEFALRRRSKAGPVRVCTECMCEGHEADAKFCRCCGTAL